MDTLDASKDSLAGKVKKSQSGIDRHSHVLLSMGTTLENIGLIYTTNSNTEGRPKRGDKEQ